ncbi:hypothetical protein ACFYKX_09490 [Cytobacillus sp. FJAT-54145]|uniref:Uncharacterized protein n=1 Tax=Cytobacillus spartinae TaxID=3299023 RepID=A0ABW6KDT2_9BACI
MPAFYNGFEYARTYSYDLDKLEVLDLVEQEIDYLQRNKMEIPTDIVLDGELTKYLPYDELEEGESFGEPFIMTVEIKVKK